MLKNIFVNFHLLAVCSPDREKKVVYIGGPAGSM